MTQHFIFSPGTWMGEGSISFSTSEQRIHYYTKWIVHPATATGIQCEQQVEIQDGSDRLYNHFHFTVQANGEFKLSLSNENLNNAHGVGIYNDTSIGWDFPPQSGISDEFHFEGVEVYRFINDDSYETFAEYFSGQEFKTQIQGKLWKKAE